MKARPLSVTIVGWFLIVSAILSMASIPIVLSNTATRRALENGPMPFEFQIGWSIATSILTLACAIAILKGRNWGRVVYVAASLAGILLTLATSRVTPVLLIATALIAVIAIILFRRPANDFFGKSYWGRGAAADASPTD